MLMHAWKIRVEGKGGTKVEVIYFLLMCTFFT